MLKIDKSTLIKSLFPIIIFLTLLEIIYLPTDLGSGSFNVYITQVYLVMGLIYFVYRGFHINIKEILILGIAIMYIYLWNYTGNNSYVYAISIVILYLIRDFKIKRADIFFTTVLFSGVIIGGLQYFQGAERITGFFSSSPTLFSYIILICMTYFSLSNYSFKKIIFINLCAVITIYFTGSRSTLLCAAMLVLYSIYKLYKKTGRKSKVAILIFFILPSLIAVFFNYNNLKNFELREGAEYSNQARNYVIEYFTGDIFGSLKDFFIGKGGGYSTYITPKILNLELDYYPLHQDFIMWMVEYGMIGVILLVVIYYIINRNINITREKKIFILILFVVGTFHNIFISPISLVMIKILYNSLESGEENHER